ILSDSCGLTVSIAAASDEFNTLVNTGRWHLLWGLGLNRIFPDDVTLKIQSSSIDSQDAARDLLLKIGQSLLFHFDINIHPLVPIRLRRDRYRHLGVPSSLSREYEDYVFEKRYLAFDLDKIRRHLEETVFLEHHEALDLYWNARTALGAPLYQLSV
ncbi:MAG: hypothetical protein QF732_09855, partial [Nitrospinaceae bacterium]|nr:hypothetical protein [Nitrospinaceae bacterium]